ncbi:hypothetical protein ACFRK5_17000 [Streptomyces niveus]|uniref:hypothetical protein n=1 Tax=Streptomyces niveus TaxID=193462 RepID=UPI0036BDD0FA
MRDLIARALTWMLRLLLPAQGRHSATATPPTPEPAHVNPWDTPWPTPTPKRVDDLYAPLDGEEIRLVRPYALTEFTMKLGVIHERRRAAELASLGVDYPYAYEGDHFTQYASAAAGVTA